MHNNYYFLRQLTPVLEGKLQDLQLMACWSQEKDELVMGFAAARGKNKNYKELFLKVVLQPAFSCLFLSDVFERAKRNSVDLFDPLLDLKVLSVRQFQNERCFAMVFEQDYTLVFKLFGNRSNLILFQNEQVIDVFHSRLVEDNALNLNQFDRQMEQHYEAFVACEGNAQKIFPTFGKIAHAQIQEQESPDLQSKWAYTQTILQQLENPQYYLVRWRHQLHLSLLPVGEILQTFHNPLEALHAYYIGYTQVDALDDEKGEALRRLMKLKKQTDSYLLAAYQDLDKKHKRVKNEEIGHILMANLHQIPENVNEVELFDFYREEPIKISLKSDLSPQRNAENYYRKAKNEQIEADKRAENMAMREAFLQEIEEAIEQINAIEKLRDLRSFVKKNELFGAKKLQDPSEQFKKYTCEGFDIWVGRNAKNNDVLTKSAFKEDLWLHARDVAGSHVIVKYKAGKNYPNTVIERAAGLAAWYSKRKNETLAPVIMTRKKYVRKPKGLADGMVVLDKEEVLMIEPKG